MAVFDDLRKLINFLEKDNQLVRVAREVDPILEINAIVDRLARKQGPAVLFENVKGASMPVLGNVFGSHLRVALSVGGENFFEHAQKKYKEGYSEDQWVPDARMEKRVRESFMYSPVADSVLGLGNFLKTLPVEVDQAPCKEVVYEGDDVDINMFPLTKLWPQDGERFITMPLVITRDPETGDLNAGTYRIMYLDKNKACMHWLPKKHGNAHWQKAEEMGLDLPVVVVVGCDPGLELSGVLGFHPPMDEFIMTSFLQDRGVEVIKADLSDLPVPAGSEVVLEGIIRPGVRASEGPFGEFHGYYSPPKDTPVFEIQRITTRKDPIWHMATTGRPITEIHYMAKASERLSMASQSTREDSEIVDMSLASEVGSLYLMTIAIKKDRPYHAKELIESMWDVEGQTEFVTNIIVVDDDIDPHNLAEVMWAFSLNVRADQDLVISDIRDQDLEHPGMFPRGRGARLGIDATRKWKEENYLRERPDLVSMDEEVTKKVLANWEGDGLP